MDSPEETPKSELQILRDETKDALQKMALESGYVEIISDGENRDQSVFIHLQKDPGSKLEIAINEDYVDIVKNDVGEEPERYLITKEGARFMAEGTSDKFLSEQREKNLLYAIALSNPDTDSIDFEYAVRTRDAAQHHKIFFMARELHKLPFDIPFPEEK